MTDTFQSWVNREGEPWRAGNEGGIRLSSRRDSWTSLEPGVGWDSRAEQVSVSSQNRNFPGRSGPGRLYLVSPYSVAASVAAGRVAGWG